MTDDLLDRLERELRQPLQDDWHVVLGSSGEEFVAALRDYDGVEFQWSRAGTLKDALNTLLEQFGRDHLAARLGAEVHDLVRAAMKPEERIAGAVELVEGLRDDLTVGEVRTRLIMQLLGYDASNNGTD